MRVLFVCTGNTCRSPFAAAVARREGLDAESAGLSAFEDSQAPSDAVAVAAEYGIDLAPHRARQVTPALLDEADLVVAMTGDHLSAIESGKARLLVEGDVDDPIGRGVDAYRGAYGEIESGVRALAGELR
jgi:protein-tyrosine-phosphatase